MEEIGPGDLDPTGSMEEQLLVPESVTDDQDDEDRSPGDSVVSLTIVGDLDNNGPAALAIPQNEGSILSVPESAMIATEGDEQDGTLLQVPDTNSHSSAPGSSEQEVIGLLLQAENDSGTDQQTSGTLTGEGMSGLQAITLPDGTTAYIQQDGKLIEGQAVQLEDGSTAIVQAMVKKEDIQSGAINISQCTDVQSHGATDLNSGAGKFIDGQAVQLEDGTTAYIHSTPKDGFQAVQLEDGSTAYISPNCAQGIFVGEGEHFDPSALNLGSLGSQFDEAGPDNGDKSGAITMSANAMAIANQDLSGLGGSVTSARAIALGDRAFRCTYDNCGKLYTTQHHLKVHERSHTGDRPFSCEFAACGKTFATGYGLKSHTRVHTGEKPYKCPEEVCGKAFKTSGDLQKHVRTHTGEKPFKCPFEGCDRSFTTSNIRKVHIRTHTGERPYICTEEGCGKAFASATNYKNHIRIHTGEKPYVCTIQGCGKRFTEYSSLYKHHVVHTHSKPYVCNHCGKHYRQTSTLAMHKRTAHGDDSEDDPAIMIQQDDSLGIEMPNKKIKLQHVNLDLVGQDEGEGTLVISDPQLTMVTEGDSVRLVTPDGGIASLGGPQHISLQQLPQAQVMATGEQHQIYLVTDPSQLQALQALASQHTAGGLIPVTDIQGITTVDGLGETGSPMDHDACTDSNPDSSIMTLS